MNVTDEALVMQVVLCYFPRWNSEYGLVQRNSDKVGGGVGRQIGGAKKGRRQTGCRTMDFYEEYCAKFQKVKTSRLGELWDTRLQEEAINQHQREMEENIKSDDREQGCTMPIHSTGFAMDICNGCFDGEIEESDETIEGTAVTEQTEV